MVIYNHLNYLINKRNVTFFPKEENFSQILYFTNNKNNNENNNIYLRCIFVISNCNDFSCYEIQSKFFNITIYINII